MALPILDHGSEGLDAGSFCSQGWSRSSSSHGDLRLPVSCRLRLYSFGRVIAPSEAEETSAAYLAKTPVS